LKRGGKLTDAMRTPKKSQRGKARLSSTERGKLKLTGKFLLLGARERRDQAAK